MKRLKLYLKSIDNSIPKQKRKKIKTVKPENQRHRGNLNDLGVNQVHGVLRDRFIKGSY